MKQIKKLRKNKSQTHTKLRNILIALVLFLGVTFPFSHKWFKNLSTPSVLADTVDPVLVAAGDIASCSNNRDEATAQLIDTINGTVITLGDNVYSDGTATEFNQCYDPTWGRHKTRTRPSAGNHDYHVAGAAGYFGYFGSLATPNDPTCTSGCNGYYSYNVGDWHIITLNSEIAHDSSSAQVQWLNADLAANPTQCTLAYWHKPRFSSGANHGSDNSFQPFWQTLYNHHADVVLNGHDHEYERFGLQSPTGQADPNGIREFVVGTGGASLYSFATPLPNSEIRDNTSWGVLKLTLHQQSYDWEFVPASGSSFTDTGTANCVGLTGPTPTLGATPTPPISLTPTPTSGSTNNVSRQIGIGSDDAEEAESSGSVSLTSSDLEFVMDGSTKQTLGMRFTDVYIPKGALITNAYIEFTADEQQTDNTTVTIYGQAEDNPLTFISTVDNISSRLKTGNSALWTNIPIWTVGQKYQTPSLVNVVSEIINRPGWTSGNAMVFIATGTGHRTADAFEGGASISPKLVINFNTGSSTPTPTPLPTTPPVNTPTTTPTAMLTPTAPTGDQIVVPVTDDAIIRQGRPTTNYGLASRLEVDNSPVKHMLLKFNINGIGTRTVNNAKIRLHNVDKSSSGGVFYLASHSNWTESSVSWNTSPAIIGTSLATLGNVSGTGTNPVLYDIPVTAAITGDGSVSFRITSPSSDGADYVSKQGAANMRPQLIITLNP